MKKILFVLLVFSLGVFATDLSINTQGFVGFDLNKGGTNTIKLNDASSAFNYKNDSGEVNLVLNWSNALGSSIADDESLSDTVEYFWVDSKVAQGVLRLGKQELGIQDYSSPLGTTPYLDQVNVEGNGASYIADVSGYTTKLYYAGNVFPLDNKDVSSGEGAADIAVLIQTDKGLQFGAVYSYNNTADVRGTSFFMDYETQISNLNLMFQLYYDLNDEAGKASVGHTEYTNVRQIINVAMDYSVDSRSSFYAGYTTELNDNNHNIFKSSMLIGVKYKLSDVYSGVLEYNELDMGGSSNRTAKVAVVFDI